MRAALGQGDQASVPGRGLVPVREARWYVAVGRQLFTVASILSLLLCGALVVFWIRSYSRPGYLRYRDPSSSIAYGVWLYLGRVQVDRVTEADSDTFDSTARFRTFRSGSWDCGQYDLAAPSFDVQWEATPEQVGFDNPSSTWGPFGWHTGNYSGLWFILINTGPQWL